MGLSNSSDVSPGTLNIMPLQQDTACSLSCITEKRPRQGRGLQPRPLLRLREPVSYAARRLLKSRMRYYAVRESVMDPFTATALASQSCIMSPFVLLLRRKVLKQTLSSPFYA